METVQGEGNLKKKKKKKRWGGGREKGRVAHQREKKIYCHCGIKTGCSTKETFKEYKKRTQKFKI